MPSEAMLLGVDVGTTAVKAGAFFLDGRLAAEASASYALDFDAQTSAAEQDPQDWWRAAALALRQLTAQIDPAGLLALSVGGQGPTLVAMDAQLTPVAPAMTWMDRRGYAEAQRLGQLMGRPLPPHAFVAKVSWLRQQRPETYAAARWFCQAWDYVAAQLTCQVLASTSAGIAPWDDELIEAAGLDQAKFPPLHPMGRRVGAVTPEAAQATGLPAGLPVIGGISDYFEGLLGTSAVEPGLACDNGGASQSFNVCWDAPAARSGLFCTPSFIDGQWFIGGPISTTGKALDWWCSDVLKRKASDEALLAEAAAVPAGCEGLIFLPYLAGERAPLSDPNARGVFFGLSLHHQRAHLTRAVLEAVGFAIRHMIEHIEAGGAQVREIRSCGGQARNEAWGRIKSDVTGRSLVVLECTDSPMLGAAVIAGVGVGALGGYEAGARQMLRTGLKLEPDLERHAHYQKLYGIYRDLYEAVRPSYERLRDVYVDN